MSIFAHNIALPCPGNEWDALNPVDWLRVRQPTQHLTKKPPSSYLPGLHPDFKVNVVTEGYSSNIFTALCAVPNFDFAVNEESALGVQMILMGMMAVAWDCRTRGGMGVKFRDGTQHWRSIVLNGMCYLLNRISQLSDPSSCDQSTSRLGKCSRSHPAIDPD